MLDFLGRRMRKRNEPETKAGVLCDERPDEMKKTKLNDVESFIRKNNYTGTSLTQYSLKCLSQIAREKEISQGAFFVADVNEGRQVIRFLSGFATPDPDGMQNILEIGEGFPGQVAKDGTLMNISDIPEGYLEIESGLGKASPVSLLIFPVKHENNVLAVIEVSSFRRFTKDDEQYFSSIAPSVAEQLLKCKNKN
jgi:GAF domain-containing protein